MHPLFQVQELVRSILQWCDRKSNAKNAVVCRSWSQHALAFVWEEITDINVVFSLLGTTTRGSDEQRYFSPPPTAAKWRRFRSSYAPLVRKLCLGTLVQAQQARMGHLFHTIARLRFSDPVFPNLTTLVWRDIGSAGYSHQSIIFMNPNVKTFRLNILNTEYVTREVLSEYFLAVSERMPSLETVEIQTHSGGHDILKDPLISLVKSLPNLSKLSLPSFLNVTELIDQLSLCSHLRTIQFTRFDRETGVERIPPLLKQGGFSDLQRLSVHTTYPTLAHFLRESSALPPLSDLQVRSSSRAGDTPAAIKELLEIVAFRFEQTLTRVALEIDTSFPPDRLSPLSSLSIIDVVHFQHIEPVLRCSRISSFILTHSLPLSIENEDLSKLAVAWPSLTHLRLCDDPQRDLPSTIVGVKRPDLSGILPFSNSCPDLQVLWLRLTPEVYPASETLGIRPLRHLRMFSPGNPPCDRLDDVDVSMFLSLVLPASCQIAFETNWGNPKPSVPEEWTAKWRDVRKGLVLIDALRDRVRREVASVVKVER